MKNRFGIRAKIAHCVGAPSRALGEPEFECFDDGLLIIESGRVAWCGDYSAATDQGLDQIEVVDRRSQLLVPGFIDCHVHYPQIDIIGSYGEQLLEWLQTYTYPAEIRYADRAYATAAANLFVGELLRNGTTTAMVFPTVHPHSVDCVFEAASAVDMRMISGKVMMDRNSPEALCDTPKSAYSDSRELLERWHGNGRALYAITPRFAATSSPAQLAIAGRLAQEFPDSYVHTHLSESHAEISWTRELFPQASDYLNVYERYGLVRERSVFAHCIHLSDSEISRFTKARAAAAFCPSSNLFLGSGLFDAGKMSGEGVEFGLGSDVGAGTSLSMLQSAGDAYKVLQMRGQSLPAMLALYYLTLGAARALCLDDRLGNFTPGKEADFLLLDVAATPLTEWRTSKSESLQETLFALITMGDDRAIAETYVSGKSVHRAVAQS